MATIEINDLNESVELSEEDLKHVKGGGLLLPAVQKVRLTGGANVVPGDGSVRVLGDGSVRVLGDGSV